jgi:hypothetical protein
MKFIVNDFDIGGQMHKHQVCIFDCAYEENGLPLHLNIDSTELDYLLDEDAERFSGIIPDNFGYKEKVLLCPDPKITVATIGLTPFPLRSGTSYELVAWREDPDNELGVNPGHVVSVHGITVTADGFLVYGKRGGDTATAGQGEAAPGGNLADSWGMGLTDLSKDPLFATYFAESVEELDIDQGHLTDVRIVAVQTDPQFRPTINFIFAAHTDYTFREVEEFHTQAMEAVGKGMMYAVARDLIAAAGHRNFDAWEKDYLVGIPLDTLEDCIQTKTIPGKGEILDLSSTSLGDLQVALELLKRDVL